MRWYVRWFIWFIGCLMFGLFVSPAVRRTAMFRLKIVTWIRARFEIWRFSIVLRSMRSAVMIIVVPGRAMTRRSAATTMMSGVTSRARTTSTASISGTARIIVWSISWIMINISCIIGIIASAWSIINLIVFVWPVSVVRSPRTMWHLNVFDFLPYLNKSIQLILAFWDVYTSVEFTSSENCYFNEEYIYSLQLEVKMWFSMIHFRCLHFFIAQKIWLLFFFFFWVYSITMASNEFSMNKYDWMFQFRLHRTKISRQIKYHIYVKFFISLY